MHPQSRTHARACACAQMSSFANAEIFAATTLLVVLGTSVLTSLAGLSLALGAFLAGLLIAETEYALQVGWG